MEAVQPLRQDRVAKWRNLILQDALDERAHFELGREYLRAGMYLEAAAEFRRCVELNPEFIAAWMHLAEAYRHVGVEKEAQAALATAAELKKKRSHA
ncbi:MAG: hypothetical protein KatS3mg130_1544 [Candidatus Sumerlaea sp.]|nr:MAG: hypothetical protein KatS3mg130_1544 [Candidatus Sumerlaea sp.]